MNPLARVIALAFLVACEAPVSVSPSPSPTPTSATPPPATASVAPRPYRYAMLYGEFLGAKQPQPVSEMSLNGGAPHTVAALAPEHDGRFAIHPDSRSLAILDKLDHHLAHTTTWRIRLVDLVAGTERDVIGETTDAELDVPWDIAWSASGTLLLVTRKSLDAVDVGSGARHAVVSFPSGTIGVTFRDTQHPLIVVSQTLQTSSIYVVDPAAPGTRGEATPVRHIVDRPIAGYTEYAMRPGTDEILELVTRYDRTVTLSLLTATSAREWKLEGPAVEGIVALAGTTPSAAYFIWPIQKTDPAALGVEGSAFLYSATYDATLETVAGLRNWGEFGPLGVSPDGRAVVIPIGERAQSDARFSIAICCERRPSPQLLGFGDRYVIGWIAER